MATHIGVTSQQAADGCPTFNNTIWTGATTVKEFELVKSSLISKRKNFNLSDLVGFTFNDPSAATLSAYTWDTSPDARATSTSDCIVLIMNGNNPNVIVADVQSCNADTTLPA
ncbi:hypothetical protein CRE_16936 [Caenorhabditis remanei]|uniref:Uncharacterized protein n=1 Tax=Caenorhabditis remanei TaxID=31234 RepID=E3N2C2_CAERE|nr:hypothetical protein CRE_16936 [Caenorhabditis remanei]